MRSSVPAATSGDEQLAETDFALAFVGGLFDYGACFFYFAPIVGLRFWIIYRVAFV